jgi:hypothetical protein
MAQINMTDLDKNLLADVDSVPGYTAHEFDYEGATVSNQCWHVVHSADDRRGGIVFVGSGSSGYTAWTDAVTPEEVLERFLADEMVA